MHDVASAAARRKADPIRARLIGSEKCEWSCITAKGTAPALVLCRELIAAGLDPDRALEVYRGAILALRIRSIGDGARLVVKTAGNGAPVFAVDAPSEGAAASRITRNAAVQPTTHAEAGR